ncbi:MAG: hypothetical protein Q9169_007135 [Polycauliona sp. 2 TL-2023]
MLPLWSVRLEIALIGASALVAFLYLIASHLLFLQIDQKSPDRGAVVSENKICTQIGIDLLEAGGNAVDAAIDFRETAPAAAHTDMFKHDVQASIVGGLASGVPGQLRGLEYIHSHYGALPWPDVIRPSVKLARNGFVVTEDLAKAMGVPRIHDRRAPEKFPTDHRFLTDKPEWALDFAPNGTRLGLGDVMKRQRYADTLEDIALHGADSFYNGKLASQVVKTIRKANGAMSITDLAQYSVITREPVEIDFHGHHVFACGEPASGAVILSILKTIEGYQDFESAENLNLSTHRLIEAMRFGYAEVSQFLGI